MINHNEWLIVGLLTSPHGINGKIRVKSLSDLMKDLQNLEKDGYKKKTRLLENLNLSLVLKNQVKNFS